MSSKQTAADRLKEFARSDKQDGGRSPPQTRSGGTSALEIQKPSTPQPQPEKVEKREKPPKLTLEQMNAQLMEAIHTSNAALTGKMDEIKNDIGLIRHDMQSMRDRMAEVENRISILEDAVNPMPKQILSVEKQIATWQQKTDDFENRMRRNNLRIVGLPEKAEGFNPGDFIEKWLKNVFSDMEFSSAFAVERAHRVPAVVPKPGLPPRPLLARLLNCRDRDAILRKARQKGEIHFENSKVSIFPDFSLELQKQRATFFEVKRRMREAGIEYSMAYPARLRVEEGGKTMYFSTAEQAKDWMRTVKPSLPH